MVRLLKYEYQYLIVLCVGNMSDYYSPKTWQPLPHTKPQFVPKCIGDSYHPGPDTQCISMQYIHVCLCLPID